MPAFKYNLYLEQGVDFTRRLTWKAGEPAIPVDLTGCTGRAEFREEVDSTTPVLTLSTAAGSIILGGVNGTVDLVFRRADTEGKSWREGYYDVELTFPGDLRTRLVKGKFSLDPEVTRGG